ncbi:hypothetical protein ACJMK2_032660 [Sinanodonta woodiana]|uniref:Ribosomal protein S7 n=1 Tax=Sinanodonta woodiana TaxID=1069815 RepID=A0ABD3X303_SINWO
MTTKKLKKQLAVKRTHEWRLQAKLNQSTEDIPNTSFSSRYARFRQVKKTKLTLPRTPQKRAEVVKKLIQSPTTSKILTKEGIIVTPECKKKLKMAEDVIASLQESIHEVKQPNSSKSEKKHAYNILKATILNRTLNKCGIYARKLFSFSHRSKKTANRQWWQNKYAKEKRTDLMKKSKYLLQDIIYHLKSVEKCQTRKKW